MALLLMEFQWGLEGDHYQEVKDGVVTRWFDVNGNEITLPANGDRGVAYSCKDPNPAIPSWYTETQ